MERYAIELSVEEIVAINIACREVWQEKPNHAGAIVFMNTVADVMYKMNLQLGRIDRQEKKDRYYEILARIKDLPNEVEERVRNVIIDNAELGFPKSLREMSEHIKKSCGVGMSKARISAREKEMELHRPTIRTH